MLYAETLKHKYKHYRFSQSEKIWIFQVVIQMTSSNHSLRILYRLEGNDLKPLSNQPIREIKIHFCTMYKKLHILRQCLRSYIVFVALQVN